VHAREQEFVPLVNQQHLRRKRNENN